MSFITTAQVALDKYNLQWGDLTGDEQRRIEQALTCRFIPATGGYLKRCFEAATQRTGAYKEQRCDRHAAIDERTARNRARNHGWKFDGIEAEPFSAHIAARDAVEVILNGRAFDKYSKVQARARDCAKYLLAHIESLTAGERSFLLSVTTDRRVVR